MIGKVLELALQQGASDIIITSGNYPAIKKSGEVMYITEFGQLTPKEIEEKIFSVVPPKLLEEFKQNLELDFSLELQNYGRFRANAFKQKNGFGIVFRVIPETVPEFENLGLPKVIQKFSHRKSGLILITGGVGSGKSTTMAALINEINKTYNKHIITVEDPIEVIHTSQKSLIEQREVGNSTMSFENGLKYALRQASDVIMIGEMRDLETFRLALRAAETGNLVFATLHTSGAARTISRVVDMFPGEEKSYIRSQLAESLLGVIWQDLIKTEDGNQVVATEVMVKNTAIENMIREDNIHQIDGAIETGKADGMIPMKKYLDYLLEKQKISTETHERHIRKYGLE